MDSARAAVRPLTAVGDHRRLESVGCSARLEMVFGVRRGRTVLTHGYAEAPLRVGRALSEGDGVHIILASSAPGIFGGDTFEQCVVVEPGARVRLTSQSALQVHPGMTGGVARIRSHFDVQGDGELRCHWDPLIPFAESRFVQGIDVTLGASARLLWDDAFMAGREGRNERWHFDSLRHELRIVRESTLEYLERYRIAPAESRVHASWVARGCCYFCSTLASGWEIAEGRVADLQRELTQVASVHAAVDQLGSRLVLARMTSSGGPSFHDARTRVICALGSPAPIVHLPAIE